MKKKSFLICFLSISIASFATFSRFVEFEEVQPDGTVLTLYASGDDTFHWIHNIEGYTILKGTDGFCYYAEKLEDGALIPSLYRADKDLPPDVSIQPWLKLSKDGYLKKKRLRNEDNENRRGVLSTRVSHTSVLNNIVIFISFKDRTVFSKKRSVYDSRFNSLNSSTGSLKDYYLEVSYDNLTIESSFYPKGDLDAGDIGYVDFHPKSFYSPYNVTSNVDGYRTNEESTNREHNLIVNAIDAVRQEIEQDFTPEEIDNDGDGYVDNICFIVQGNSDGWSDLLWAHRWSLYTRECYIHGKRVMDYVFQPENQVVVTTLCHEMFHALGAPDLYHYDEDFTDLDPVGEWDLMHSGKGHMGAYMKWKYTNGSWIKDIPELTSSGTYRLFPLTHNENNCYKVKSSKPEEFYVLEYRKKAGKYESTLPRSGLLIYRIDTSIKDGNRNGPPDEVYIYRPYGSLSENGFLDQAAYQTKTGHVLTDKTFPKPFLSDNSDGGLRIYNVSIDETSLVFDVEVSSSSNSYVDIDNSSNVFSYEDNFLVINNVHETLIAVSIIDSSGRIVYNSKKNEKIDLRSFSKGFYIVSVNCDKIDYRKKIIIN